MSGAAFESVGAKRRFRLLDARLRRVVCDRYEYLRFAGYTHEHAAQLIRNDPNCKALPLWAMLLVHVLLRMLSEWWKSRD